MTECKSITDVQGALSDAINDMAQFKEFLRDIRPFVGDNIKELISNEIEIINFSKSALECVYEYNYLPYHE